MTPCPHCGAATNPGSSFCAACGSSLLPPATGAQALPSALAPARVRPVGVTIVGVVALIGGAFMLFVAAASFLFFGAIGAMFLPWWGEFGGFVSALALVAVLLFAGIAGLAIATGMGVLRGREWAWIATLVLVGLMGLNGLMELASRRSGGVVSLLVSAAVIAYFLTDDVKRWFGRA